MDNLKNFSNKSSGTLFIVSTPIGNLGDISQRALDTLKSVDVIICEDTRVTKKLLSKFSINSNLKVYNDHSSDSDRGEIISVLLTHRNVAMVSDAGTPLISDPGFKLVEACQKNNISVSPIPGPSALIAALSSSGLPSDTFFFAGFFPRTSEKSSEILSSISTLKTTAIFYESPKRILKTLEYIQKLFGQINVCVGREITKLHEEFITGDIDSVIGQLQQKESIKGEIVLLLNMRIKNTSEDSQITQELEILMRENSLKDSVTLVSKKLKLPKNKVYDIAIKLKQ